MSIIAYERIKRAKTDILEGLVLLPKHKHRDPATVKDCPTCVAKNHFMDAYKRLPSDQTIKDLESAK